MHRLTNARPVQEPEKIPARPCADWLVTGALQKMVLVVTSVATKEVLERWTFDIQTDKEVLAGGWVGAAGRLGRAKQGGLAGITFS